ncbi:hypothetical protein OIU77_004480 [Salix suchowensis]|uniref:Uncharacterized protein n=1 Tax=Salix suchowensis TaxID=1278906 RepID=A0ABQ9AWD3_9ROSI|nr:hypothetical protein OIU77_004480 [Salix suchowensis]
MDLNIKRSWLTCNFACSNQITKAGDLTASREKSEISAQGGTDMSYQKSHQQDPEKTTGEYIFSQSLHMYRESSKEDEPKTILDAYTTNLQTPQSEQGKKCIVYQ